jgi:nucleoside phosphorylase
VSIGHSGAQIGIVTALPVEFDAVQNVIDLPDKVPAKDDPNYYRLGSAPSADLVRPHSVAAAVQARDGTRSAAALCTDMLRSFPDMRCLLLVGIAGGVANSGWGKVGFGDIVVATDGIVDYGHLQIQPDGRSVRRAVEGLSAAMLRADREIQLKERQGVWPWRPTLSRDRRKARFAPPEQAGWPQVHRGLIGSADQLVRSAVARDEIGRAHSVLAVEMEGAGLAAAAHLHGRHWFMVRGIADLANDRKDGRWHGYASLVAAAYAAALLAECPPFPHDRSGAVRQRQPDARGLGAIVDALLAVPHMRDDYRRRTVLDGLPMRIRTQVPDSVVARLHVIGLVQTCLRFDDGREALREALRLALGPDSPELAALDATLAMEWPDH